MQNYLDHLNENQVNAVKDIDGPCMIIAGAGSGKTRVLTYRIVNLINSGIKPRSILALTFTNKAAKEMKERIDNFFSYNISKDLWMGTFHSIFSKILRIEGDFTGFSPNYTIYDAEDSKSVIKSIIRELNLDDKVYKPSEVLSRISFAKNNLLTPQLYSNNNELISKDNYSRKPEIAKIYSIYSTRCKQSNSMDFDDLLLNTNILFRDFPDILEKYQDKFQYILVDEYQDTNFSQYLVLKRLASKHKNICVVGDDAQSIYSFRGARIENILNFKNDYPDFKLFKLEQNYRSTQNIVAAANSLISKNKGQIQKLVWSDNEKGDKIKIIEAFTDNEEGFKVTNLINESLKKDGLNYGDYAILYRTNAQSRIFEESLRKRNIPYKIYGGISFYKRKEIKDVIAYFRLIINHKDDEAIKRIINYPGRGIGKSTIEKLIELAGIHNKSIWEIISSIDNYDHLLNKGTIGRINLFVELINTFSSKLNNTDAFELASEIVNSSGILQELIEEKTAESHSKQENIQELLNGIKEFTVNETTNDFLRLDQYIENVSLLIDNDDETKDEKNKVVLMTVHSAKGLEFQNVYIVGLEKDLFPSIFSMDSPDAIEEERRLFYVAITRAKKNVTISYANSRYKWGNLTNCQPSKFINEIDTDYIETEMTDFEIDIEKKINNKFIDNNKIKSTFFEKAPKFINERKLVKHDLTKETNDFQGSELNNLEIGMQVEHQRFGIGKIINLEGGAYANLKATVEFNKSGTKQLLVKFAKLKII